MLIDECRYPINGARYGQIPLVVADNGNILRRVFDANSFGKEAKNRINNLAIQQSGHAIKAPQTLHAVLPPQGPSQGPYRQGVTHTTRMSYPPSTPQMTFSSQGSRQVQTTYQHPLHLMGAAEESLYEMEEDDMSSALGDYRREVSQGLYARSGSSVNPTNVAFTGMGSAQWVPMEGAPMTATRHPPSHHPVSPSISLPSLSLLTTWKPAVPSTSNTFPQFYQSYPTEPIQSSQGQTYQNTGTSGTVEMSRMSGRIGSSGQQFIQSTDPEYANRLKSVGAYLQR